MPRLTQFRLKIVFEFESIINLQINYLTHITAYECKDEGFFPHTKSCKKYFWCLAVPGSGMVAHTFTCPQGLYFNSLTDGCDFRRNVDCEGKDDTEEDSDDSQASSSIATTAKTTSSSNGGGETLEDVLEQIKSAGTYENICLT